MLHEKYPVELQDKQVISLPLGANINAVQVIQGVPYVWADMVSLSAEKAEHRIHIFGPGRSIIEMIDNPRLRIIGCFQLEESAFCYDVCEEINPNSVFI